ncbi:MAG: ACT domain-containing protein [Actinomycetota bacterium]
MAGITDLGELLTALEVERRPGRHTFVVVDGPVEIDDGIGALIVEDEGITAIVQVDVARAKGWAVDFEAAWLTLTVHSSLEAVGLTAAVSQALADAGIASNVLAGFHHDHLLVPVDRADEAVELLVALRRSGQPTGTGRGATSTTGVGGGSSPRLPTKGASLKTKTPPSDATRRYPSAP